MWFLSFLYESGKSITLQKKFTMVKVEDKVIISPDLTGLDEWLSAVVVEVEDNKFNGVVISAKAENGQIYFGQEKFFKQA